MADPREAGDRPGWTVWRVTGWIAATFLALVVAGIAMGVLAGHMDRGTGGHAWRDGIRPLVPVVVVAIMGGAALMALRRSWPRRPRPGADEWEHRAAARARRTMRAWVVTFAAVTVPVLAIPAAASVGVGAPLGIVLLAVGLIFTGVAAYAGTAYYLRVIDEQERQANLYCGYVGLSTYLILYFVQMLLRHLSPDVPRMDDAIMAVTVVAALITFVRVRFR